MRSPDRTACVCLSEQILGHSLAIAVSERNDIMKKCMLLFCAILLASATSARAAAPELKTDEQKTLYALGLAMSQSLSSFKLTDTELDLIKAGLTDGVLTFSYAPVREEPRAEEPAPTATEAVD
jgi:hypothetical protein